MINNPKYKDFFDDKTIEELFKSAPLYDNGKLGESDNILLKPGKLTEEEFNEDAERFQEREAHRAEMEAIMESGDYEAWKEHVAEMPRASMMAEQITEENFDTFVEMHNARVNGDHETAKELASELGIEKGRKGFGHGRGMRGCASPMAE